MTHVFLRSAVSIALVAGLGTASFNAAAIDTKAISTLECRQLNSSQTGLTFSYKGVTNTSTADRSVICPIPKDQTLNYNSTEPGSLVAWFRTGSVAGKLSCTWYMGSAVSPIVTRSATSPSTAASKNASLKVLADGYPAGYVQIQQNMVCTLSPKVTLAHFFFQEYGTTN
jgi:hypothetical protein